MTNKQFCKVHSGYYGEEIDNVKQIAKHCFTGEELKEYVEHHIAQLNAKELCSDMEVSPEEKANWLKDRFMFTALIGLNSEELTEVRIHAKNCALIAVDEILNENISLDDDVMIEFDILIKLTERRDYWKKVKKALES